MLGASAKTTGCVLDVARQRGGAEPSVVTLHDHSRFGNDGAMTNVTWERLPSGLWVMEFDGATSVVSLGAAKFDTLTSACIELWYRPNIDMVASGNHRPLFEAHTDGTNSIWVYFDKDIGQMRLRGYIGGANLISVVGSIGLTQVWHHCVSNLGASGAELFIDTISQGTDANTECFPDIAPTTANNIGYTTLLNRYWSGNIVLFRIYNYALSPPQIRSRFAATRRFIGV